ncbi:MAG: hypothetical protein IJW45_06410 [Oscillospiraceae bacterium]|nr:hypothetical protein [Oscillospiraceae bacterium]
MTRKIYILLTRFPGLDAKALSCYTRFPYSHASVGLEEDTNTFYSFVVKGFIVEDIARYCKADRPPFPCALYELEVTQAVYDRVKDLLQNFVKHRSTLRYSYWGLLLSLIHIPSRWKGRYFCSQFVAEVLQRCKATRLKKSSTLYLPKDLHRLTDLKLVFQGDLLNMTQTYPSPAGT